MNGTSVMKRIFHSRWFGYAASVGLVALATWLKILAQPDIIPANVPILYIAAIVVAAFFFDIWASLFTCVLSVVSFDYFFGTPLHTLDWSLSNAPLFVVFLGVGLIISLLGTNLKKRELDATRELAARRQAEARLEEYKAHLEELVAQRTAELAQENLECERVEKALKASLAEKEVLLQETQHRVKNNLQVVSSLLGVQSARVKDPADAHLFLDSQERIQRMALVYNQLFQSGDGTRVSLREYVSDLLAKLVSTYHIGPVEPRTSAEVADVRISNKMAVPLGLIINEAVTNSLKYAFPDDRHGTISVNIATRDGTLDITLADDGIGLPEESQCSKTGTLGMRLISNLAEYQLGGRLEIARSGGTAYHITIPWKGAAQGKVPESDPA